MRTLIFTLSLSFTLSAMAKDVMLMNRIGPSKSELYVANADGTGEHKLLAAPGFDYHASYSYDGKWIVFTSERSGYGQADIYRVQPDGMGLEQLTDDPALDDQGVLSPNDTQLAFVSTRETHGMERAWQWLGLGARARTHRVHHPSRRHWTPPNYWTGDLFRIAEMVCRFQTDSLLRNSRREYMGCSCLFSLDKGDFSDRVC
jgi:hypothetical protein